jgi:hypothetical protein
MKKLLTLTAACVLAGGFAVTASAAQGNKAKTEISTAHKHALLAQKATKVKMVHTHLHHVVNCLVGSKGAGYDAAAGNPCKGQGKGAIPDSASDHALQSKLKTALKEAKAGLKSNSLSTAQKDAGKVAATLQNTPKQKASGGYSW